MDSTHFLFTIGVGRTDVEEDIEKSWRTSMNRGTDYGLFLMDWSKMRQMKNMEQAYHRENWCGTMRAMSIQERKISM